jgi:hypothetical protein
VALALVGDFLGRLCASERGVVIEVLPYIAYACVRLSVSMRFIGQKGMKRMLKLFSQSRQQGLGR